MHHIRANMSTVKSFDLTATQTKDPTALWQQYLATNDEAALTRLYCLLAPTAHGIAVRIAGTGHPFLDDMVQEVFITIVKLRNRTSLTTVKHFPSYFRRLAYHCCLAFYLKHIQKEVHLASGNLTSLWHTPAKLPDTHLEHAQLWEVIRHVLYFYPQYLSVIQKISSGYSRQEIATELQIKPEYVRERKYRAKQKLKYPLQDLGYHIP